jgi:RNA polymerase sigma-70 factor, ECF subfamily
MELLAINLDTQRVRAETGVETLMNSPEDLISRVRSGDEEAFRLIFKRYARSVIRFIYGMVGEADLAEELMQETFVRAYNNRNNLRDEAKLAAWIFGIARNIALNAVRSRRVRADKLIDDDYAEMEVADTDPSPDEQLLSKELDYIIGKALNTLTEDKRLVFTLKVLQQKSYEEIAEITGHSVPKLKTDLHRAKVKMRKLIRPYMENSNEL